MTKRRSPNFPHISLPKAIERIAAAYPKAHRAKADRAAMANLFGYSSLNGKSGTLLASLRQYGLLEGRKNEMSISADGETLAIEPIESEARLEAIERCFRNPTLFADTIKYFDEQLPDDEILRPYLIRKGFSTTAANTFIRNLRESAEFVDTERSTPVKPLSDQPQEPMTAPDVDSQGSARKQPAHNSQDCLTVPEGQIVLTYPTTLSESSVNYLELWLQLQLKKAHATSEALKPEFGGHPESGDPGGADGGPVAGRD